MNRISMRPLVVVAAILFVAPPAMSQAYGRVIMTNYLTERISVTVSYAACRPDVFMVSQASVTNGKLSPGINQAQAYRGACLVKKITGKYENQPTWPITEFQSGGTAVSHFYIKNAPFSVWPGIFSQSSFWDDSVKKRRDLEKSDPQKLLQKKP